MENDDFLEQANRYTDEALGLCFEKIEALREEIKALRERIEGGP